MLDPQVTLKRLYAELVHRRPVIKTAADYYDGVHNLAFTSEKFLEAFGGMFNSFSDNWCQAVTDAVEERLSVNGFRVNAQPSADENAHRIWQANELDLQAQLGHVDGLHQGAFYVTVWNGTDPAVPEITTDSCMGTIVDHHPKHRRRRLSALRTWQDDAGYEHAELFLPDMVYLFRTATKRTGLVVSAAHTKWIVDDTSDHYAELDVNGGMVNPLGVVPVVEFMNRPRLYSSARAGWGVHSEIAPVIPLQNAANKLFADLMVASEFGAFPQRHLTGYEPDEDPDTGAMIPPSFRSGPGRVWWTESAEAKFGEFATADLTQFATVIELVVSHIAKISKTPPHYLSVSADRLSGESLKSSETGLVKKVVRVQRHWGAGWEEVIRLAGMVAGIAELAGATSMETVWADAETRSESEHIDAVTKKKALDVPAPQLWEEMGYTPAQVARFPAMRAQAAIAELAAGITGAGPSSSSTSVASEVKEQADAMGVLIRAGVSTESAASIVGLAGAEFTGAVPVSLRLPETEADALEQV